MQIEIPAQFCAKFRQSANRPHLLMGCEPTAIALALIVSVIIGYSAPTLIGIGSAVALFLFLRHVLRQMAVEDPMLISIHHSSQRYRQKVWTAKPTRHAVWRAR
jgi:type IV secretory pathway TrbD component